MKKGPVAAMGRLNFIFALAILYLCYTNDVHCCSKFQSLSGTKKVAHNGVNSFTGCWKIEVPKDQYVTLNIVDKEFHGLPCNRVYIHIKAAVTNQTWQYCSSTSSVVPVTSLSDVTITFALVGSPSGWSYETSSFEIAYKIEDIMCTQKNHFRCSDHFCIHQEKVCNRIDDCKDGSDENGCETGVATVKGVNETRDSAVTWLKSERAASFGWGKETHRAITALYLAGVNHFRGGSLEEELMAKQLELQTSVALLRNSTDPMSLSDISMFINALTVTCHSPRHFYGHDLLQILSELTESSKSPIPGAYLTLCNANWTLSEKHLHNMLKLLREPSEYPFILDVQAMTIMALTCIKNKMNNFGNIINATRLYNSTIDKFITGQLSDGSFGNIYTTALITQALIASGQESNKAWNLNATVQYLMHKLNSSKDFISVYFTLPILNSKSLVDIAEVKCSSPRKKREDAEIADMRSKLGGKMKIKYSLYVGDHKDVIYTISLRVPESSSAYDIMRLAEVADHKYKFLHRKVDGRMYIYEIAGITNDPEAGKFWLLYIQEEPHINGTMHHHTKSPDKIMLEDEEHLIMWYKTAHF